MPLFSLPGVSLMNGPRGRVILVTGASSGIGEACARYLARQGNQVFGTSRRATAKRSALFEMLRMDVNEESSVHEAITTILEREKRLDVLVNNAGYSLAGAVENTSLEEAQVQFETNFFGVMRVCRAVLPAMRHQQHGYIVNISSIGGLISIPFQGLYCASKFALEGFTEALRGGVRPYGIQVVLIEPGDFHTSLTAHRQRAAGAATNSPYSDKFRQAVEVIEADEVSGPSPEGIARLLERIINTTAPGLRYSIGPSSQRFAVALKKVVPYKLFEWLLLKHYRQT